MARQERIKSKNFLTYDELLARTIKITSFTMKTILSVFLLPAYTGRPSLRDSMLL